MSGDTSKTSGGLEQLAKTVMQQIAAGKPTEEIVRELTAEGVPLESAKKFVAQVEQDWQALSQSPGANVDLYLQVRFPDMRPCSAPGLHTINGIGTMLHGYRDHDPVTDTYVKTHTFCVLFVPVIAIGAYRVAKAAGGGWHLLGKVPLSKVAKGWNWLLACSLLAAVAFVGWDTYTGSPEHQAGRKLAKADEAAAAGRLLEASWLYSEVARGSTQHARTAREKLLGLIERPDIEGLPTKDLIGVFRATASAANSAELKKAVEAAGLRQITRLTPLDLAAAFELLEAIGPIADRAVLQDRMKTLLAAPLDAAPCAVVVKVVPAARQIAGPEGEQAVIVRALDWLDHHPQTSPREALGLLNQFSDAPGAAAKRIAAARRKVLEQIVKTNPADMDAAVELALILEKDGDAKRIEALLQPHAGKLGASEGARLLGQVLAAEGRFDESYALLNPYLEQKLGTFHEAEKAFADSLQQAQERIIERLRQGTAAGFNYARYKTATQEDKDTMVDEYVNAQLKDEPVVHAARERLSKHAGMVPAALDLGMVLLYRARGMENPAARKAELERAEKTFLAVRGVAGGSDKYLLHLGQVYYWLGKHDEGHQQFDQLLTTHQRNGEMLLEVANILRELGSLPEARKLMEEAYNKNSDPKIRTAAASMRAISCTDLADKITWLERCDKGHPMTKALLAETRGEQAMAEGKHDEAAGHFREAIAIYEAQTKTTTVFNNGALACFSLFELTGDREAFNRGTEWLEKAVALSPSDAIVLGNAAQSLLRAAIQDLAGPEISLHELQASTEFSLLNYLAADKDALQKLRERVQQHVGVKKVLGHLGQVMVLSPKSPTPYLTAIQVHGYVRDVAAVRRVARQIAEAKPDLSQNDARYIKFCRYEDDEFSKEKLAARTARIEAVVQRYGNGKKGPAFAAAVGELVEQVERAGAMNTVAADRLVELAEQAHAAAPSCGSYRPLIDALLMRAAKTLTASQPEFAAAVEKSDRALPPCYSVVLALGRGDALAAAVRADKDVQKAGDLMLQWIAAFPEERGYRAWALVRVLHPDQARALARALAADELDRVEGETSLQLYAASAAVACSEYWKRLATSDAQHAREPIERVMGLGVPFPAKLLPPGGPATKRERPRAEAP